MYNPRLMQATVVVAAASLALVGCASDTGTTTAGGSSLQTVTMWLYPIIPDETAHRAYWDNTIKSFEASHKNIRIKYEIFPWANRDTALSTAIAGSKAPDLVYLNPDQMPGYFKSIEPMGKYLPPAQKSDILENVAKSITIDGQLMGAPLLTTATPLMCDKTAFKTAGVTEYPTSWADLMKLAPKFKEHGIYVTNYYGSADWGLNMTFYPLLWQAGGSAFNNDGSKVTFNSPAGVEALQYLVDLAKNGYIEKDLITTNPPMEQTAMARNKVACTWQNVPTDATPFWGKEAIKILPGLTNKLSVEEGSIGSLVMLKKSEVKDAAGQFAAFATNAANIKTYDVASQYFSPLKSTGPLYPGDAIQTATENTIPLTRAGELFPRARQLVGILVPEIQAAMLGTKSAKQALDDAAAAAEKLPH